MTDTNKTTHQRTPCTAAFSTNSAQPVVNSASPSGPAADVMTVKPTSKQAQLAALMTSDTGATLDQMIGVTGWLPHTTRAALTGLKKKGYAISSDKIDGVRTYRAIAPELA